MNPKIAIIIGAGPAGLTAAYELLQHTGIHPIVFEASDQLGGLSRTVNYKGNRIDIGGHRFFSKSDRVMDWWLHMMPMQAMGTPEGEVGITYQRQGRTVKSPGAEAGPDPESTDLVMLVRRRLSRILYRRRFFSYPVSLSADTISKLGMGAIVRIGVTYLLARLFPIHPEKSLEDFFINRFGSELYHTFFKDYTEKVWGVPCNRIKPEWGVQRVKGLSVRKVIAHALRSTLPRNRSLGQKDVETSLIEQFLYPKYGPGQMWEEVARRVCDAGGEIHLNSVVTKVTRAGERITAVTVRDEHGAERDWTADFVFSTMPIKELAVAMHADQRLPAEVLSVATGLEYRDFITVGLLLKRLRTHGRNGGALPAATQSHGIQGMISDTWIYIQEKDVKIGRLQIFNNWSPYMVYNPDTAWVGLEYFTNEGDELWSMTDEAFTRFAIAELAKIGMIDAADVLDSTLIRMPKTYPSYTGAYERFDVARTWFDRLGNLFLIGRNGMHRYNNQDHSMLTAMTAVENIRAGITSKDNIWAVNVEKEYHETKPPPLESVAEADDAM